ncbi:hypothetical protein [Candidatus Binatus sp.]|uniref:hypothetical protein n=2 Tax=Candidatus Binatus sp. TaxID=2811406 RepID=UPI003CB2D741
MTLRHAAALACNAVGNHRALLLGILIFTASCSVSCATLNGGTARTPAILVNNFGRSMSGYALDPSGRITSTGTLSYSMAEVDEATDAKVDSTGNIYVSNSSILNEHDKNSILIFPAGSTGKATPIATIAGNATRLSGVINAIAVDAGGNIFAGNVAQGSAPPSTLCVPSQNAEANDASVTAYPSGSSGDVKPIAVISGPCTGIRALLSLAVDSKGNLYVANGNSIVVFPPHSSGNVKPNAVIAGPSTGLTGVVMR